MPANNPARASPPQKRADEMQARARQGPRGRARPYRAQSIHKHQLLTTAALAGILVFGLTGLGRLVKSETKAVTRINADMRERAPLAKFNARVPLHTGQGPK